MTTWELTNVTARLLLPPGGLIVLGLVGIALIRSHVKTGAAVASFALVSLLLLSTPIVSRGLLHTLEDPYIDPLKERSADAIVVLGGGSYRAAPEYGTDTVSIASLERLRYAAYLHRQTGKPVLVTGGNPAGFRLSEAEQMKAALKDFGVAPKWLEAASTNTAENARKTHKILKRAGIESVYVVTQAWHMPRAKMAFQNAGLRVVPAPLGFKTGPARLGPLEFVPSAEALEESWHFFHEIAGIAWYRLKFARER
jgi:uncharacterized SAM-binding protein YcdF (DUF218 family)